MYANAVTIYQFKAKDAEIKFGELKKTGLNVKVHDTSNISDICKYAMKKHNIV